MNTKSNTPAQAEQPAKKIHTLSDLISFDLPRLHRNFPSRNVVTYTLDGTADDITDLEQAASNACDMANSGIEAVTDLLLNIEINKNELDTQTKIDALALIFELSRIMRVVKEIEWLLERATPTRRDQA